MILFAIGMAAISFVWLACGERLEISYRLWQLKRLNRKNLVVTENGYAIDETRDIVVFHRDRLTALGVFFDKTYRLGTLDRNARKELINALEKQFPENNYWEFTNDNVLHAWDFTTRESAWDSFVTSFLGNLGANAEAAPDKESPQ
jgi:hydroxymethylpyrimidine pyrophosphatase-like HAD family hydrolase